MPYQYGIVDLFSINLHNIVKVPVQLTACKLEIHSILVPH